MLLGFSINLIAYFSLLDHVIDSLVFIHLAEIPIENFHMSYHLTGCYYMNQERAYISH